MFWQWSRLAIQALTSVCGVGKPVAMFSPAACQMNPTASIREVKFEPWLKVCVATIAFVQLWAERSRRHDARTSGSLRAARCWLIRHTTEARIAALLAATAGVLALAHTRGTEAV